MSRTKANDYNIMEFCANNDLTTQIFKQVFVFLNESRITSEDTIPSSTIEEYEVMRDGDSSSDSYNSSY